VIHYYVVNHVGRPARSKDSAFQLFSDLAIQRFSYSMNIVVHTQGWQGDSLLCGESRRKACEVLGFSDSAIQRFWDGSIRRWII